LAGRFRTQEDTPCPFRLARFGYVRTGEFRAPKQGELYIYPTDSETLGEFEPQILGACHDHHESGCRHIVTAIDPDLKKTVESFGPFAGLFLSDEDYFKLVPEERSS
jgi:hypothetical protein